MAARPGPSPGGGGAGRGCRDGGPHVGHPLIRALRAGVFAVVCVLLSAGLHTATGGGPVALPVLSGATAATWAVAYALAARRRGRGTLLAACFVAQYALHNLFTGPDAPLSGPMTQAGGPVARAGGLGVRPAGPMAELGGHHHASPTGLLALTPDAAETGGGTGVSMLLVHVTVALVSGWWLERGETALANLLRLALASVRGFLVRLLVALTSPVTVAGPTISAASAAPAPPPPPHAAAISRRGPPLAFSVR
ncbi:hypothetical protein ACWGH8_31785 [Nonomuraea muscovyensis]|uniref:Integral membrane protein n=1 Tax=Nonomuraea muscovyensis TaxID=1124761 RepID=A0A7X0CAH5_9ACTN|nr:hypothetical protein [Nonomuraea muscovyensis]MBB6351414.1 hypothetical protein [Nonomuraea muscovyensis]